MQRLRRALEEAKKKPGFLDRDPSIVSRDEAFQILFDMTCYLSNVIAEEVYGSSQVAHPPEVKP